MKKRTVMHKEVLNVKVKFKKSDFATAIYKDKHSGKEYLLAGTLVNVKTSGEDIRETGGFMKLATAGPAADGILVHDFEFKTYHTEETGSVAVEGITYLDKLIEVGKEYPTPLTVDKTMLPEKITYVYKGRK